MKAATAWNEGCHSWSTRNFESIATKIWYSSSLDSYHLFWFDQVSAYRCMLFHHLPAQNQFCMCSGGTQVHSHRCAGIHHCYCHTHWYLSKWERDSVTFHFRTICKSRHESSLNSHSYTYVCVSRKHKIGLWWQTRHRMFSHYCSECNHYCSYRWMTPTCWSTSAHSLAASPSPPGWSRAHVQQRRAEGGEGLANFAVD